jgi:hypothetical protein
MHVRGSLLSPRFSGEFSRAERENSRAEEDVEDAEDEEAEDYESSPPRQDEAHGGGGKAAPLPRSVDELFASVAGASLKPLRDKQPLTSGVAPDVQIAAWDQIVAASPGFQALL